MNTALLLIEMQNDYFQNGRMPLEKSADVSKKAEEILQYYRAKQWQIIHVQHVSTRPDAIHFLPCTKGVEFYPALQPAKNETIIKKHYPNSFKDTTLLAYLIKNQINHLAIAGMMTHESIDSTVRAAQDLGMNCTVLSDACTTSSLEANSLLTPAQTVHHVFLAAFQSLYANVVTVKDYLQMASARYPLGA